jgi:hypothetical protein
MNPVAYRCARLIARFCWVIVGCEGLYDAAIRPGPWPLKSWLWLGAFIAFGPTLFAPSPAYRGAEPPWRLRMGVAIRAPIVMVYADLWSFACAFVVIVAWELAIVLPLSAVWPWLLAQTAAVAAPLLRALPLKFVLPEIGVYLGFQGYALVTAHVARSEVDARSASPAPTPN